MTVNHTKINKLGGANSDRILRFSPYVFQKTGKSWKRILASMVDEVRIGIVDAGEHQDKDSDFAGSRRALVEHQYKYSDICQSTIAGLVNNGKESRRFDKRSTPSTVIGLPKREVLIFKSKENLFNKTKLTMSFTPYGMVRNIYVSDTMYNYYLYCAMCSHSYRGYTCLDCGLYLFEEDQEDLRDYTDDQERIDKFVKSHDVNSDDNFLVCIESNPGPNNPVKEKDVDLLSTQFAELRNQNRNNLKKPKKNLLQQKIMDRKFDELKKRIKNIEKRKQGKQPIFAPEMGWNSIEHVIKIQDGENVREITELLRNIVSAIGSAKGTDLTEKIGNLSHTMGENMAQGATSTISSSITSYIMEIGAKLFGRDLSLAYVVVSIMLLSYMYSQGYKSVTIFLAGTTISLVGETLGLHAKLREMVYEGFQKFYKVTQKVEDEGFVPQVGSISAETISDIVSSVLFATMFPRTDFSPKKISEFFMNFGRIGQNMEQTVTFILKMLQKVCDYVSNTLGYKNFNLLLSTQDDVNSWVTNVRTTINRVAKGEIPRDRKLYDTLYQYEEIAYSLLNLYRPTKQVNSIGMMVRPLQLEIANIRRALEAAGIWTTKNRQPPVIVVFCGESQIGKSRMLRPFANALIATLGDSDLVKKANENFDSIVYSRQPEHVYWDGYTGQEICFFDEFNVVHKSLVTAENAQMDLIRCGNVFDNCLHMAELERKGTTYFRSKLILATSNSATVEAGAIDTVSYPDAVVNRVHYEVLMTVNRKYASEDSVASSSDSKHWRLDQSKLPKSGEFIYDVLDFNLRKRKPHPTQPGKMVYTNDMQRLSFKEMVMLVAGKYKAMEKTAEQIPKDDVKARMLGEQWAQEIEKKDDTELDLSLEQFEKEETSLGFAQFLEEEMREAQNMNKKNLETLQMLNLEDVSSPELFYDAEPQMGVDLRKELPLAMVTGQYIRVAEILREFSTKEEDRALSIYNEVIDASDMHVKTRREMCLLGEVYKPLLGRYLEALGVDEYMDSISVLCEDREMYLEMVSHHLDKLDSSDIIVKYLKKNLKGIGKTCAFATAAMVVDFAELMTWFGNVETTTWLALLAGVTSLFAAYKFYKFMTKESDDQKQTKEERSVFKPETGDPALEDISTSLWQKNWYTMMEGECVLGYGFFIAGHSFVFCKHFLDIWKSRGFVGSIKLVPFKGPYVTVTVPFLEQNKRDTPCTDVVVCDIPQTRVHKDISSFILDEKTLLKKQRGQCLLVRTREGHRYDTLTNFNIAEQVRYALTKDITMEHVMAVSYSAITRVGDCGAPVFVVDPTTRAAKLIGIHVAGSSRNQLGLGTLLHPMLTMFLEPQIGTVEVDAVHKIVRSVKRGAGSTGISRIVRSPLYGMWHPPAKMQAKLRPFINEFGERIDPMEKSIAKYNAKLLTYDQSLVDVATRAAVLNVETAIRSRGLELLSITREEAILGIPGKPFYDSLNRSTSPGYPWNMNPRQGYSGKERFFGKGQNLELNGPDWPELERNLDRIEEDLRKGIRSEFIFADSLKDELRLIEKAKAGSTRLFCPCPIEYLILFNQYFKSFFAGMMEVRIQAEPTIGINPYSDEWEQLRRKLVRFGESFVNAGDFSMFDALESAQILESIGESVIASFDDVEFNAVRRILWKEVFNSFHLNGRNIVEWLQSLPSGHAATSGINCLFVSTVFRMVWITANGGQLDKVRTFEKNIVLSDFGDDHVLNVAEPARELINQHTLPVLFGKLGLIYTSEDKISTPPKFRNICDVEFLKRTFRYEPRYGRHCAPLRLETILEIPYWTKVGLEESVTRTNVETAIRELALHKAEVFDEWAPKIIRASKEKLGYIPLIIDRNVLLDEIAQLDVHY